jgi:FAD/FMN-containing dehydrogenase
MKKKNLWQVTGLAVMAFLSVPAYHLVKTKLGEQKATATIPIGYANDASQLNLTKVDTIIQIPSSPKAIESQLQSILKYAKQRNLKISIAGAKHSMGGHTIYPGGIVLNMLPYKQMELDTATNILTIGSGALWEDALRYLDKYGKSIAIMQAFSSFSVGGSISVNGHGWQKDLPPISASVMGFTLMTENGAILNCSRTQNQELFKLAIGGYGLFGIILDVQLKVVENSALQLKYVKLNPNQYVDYYKELVATNPNVNLIFGRLRISDKQFLEEVALNYFEKTEAAMPALQQEKSTETQRLVFRGSVNSEYGKRLRWDLESGMNKVSKNKVYSRNELLNDDVALIENRDSASTDLLQEYFIPERNFNQYLDDIKPVLRNTNIDLLNITIRGVQKDNDSYLAYARENVFGFVFLFNQKKTAEEEQAMKKLTNLLCDVALKNEGTFYLPYRLHIDRVKMRQSYPAADSFFQLKLKYDAGALFSNKFYEHYK